MTPWTAACQAFLSFTVSQSLLKLMSIESVMLFNHLIFCHPLLFCLQTFPALGSFPISHLFATDDQSYWSFSFSISPSNEYSGLISFKTDQFDLLAVQGTLKSLPAPQLESISSLMFSLLYDSTLTSIHDYRKIIALTVRILSAK